MKGKTKSAGANRPQAQGSGCLARGRQDAHRPGMPVPGGSAEATLQRWRNQYGGMKAEEAKRLKELEEENRRLKKLLAEAELDKAILKEALEGN